MTTRKYEYKFVLMDRVVFSDSKRRKAYHDVIDQHAKEGWRLVQVFAPSFGSGGRYEVILERPR